MTKEKSNAFLTLEWQHDTFKVLKNSLKMHFFITVNFYHLFKINAILNKKINNI